MRAAGPKALIGAHTGFCRCLPTYAPWLNPIEKLWHWLKQEVLHHHSLADDWEGLKAAVAAFLARFAHGSSALLRDVGLCLD